MKNLAILVLSLTLLSFGTSASAIDGRTCEKQANKLNGAERERFLNSCLKKLSDPSHVKEVAQTNKKSNCEQNAKNKHIPSSRKGEYVNECINKNEAAAAKEASVKDVATTAPERTASNAQQAKQTAPKTNSTHKKSQKRNHKASKSAA